MLTALPFKIIVDSRAASSGTANKFTVSLPEVLHVDRDVVMYVNSASVTNTCLPVGTHIGTGTTTSVGSNALQTLTLYSIAQHSPSAPTLQKSSHRHFRRQSTTHRGLATTSTVAHTTRTHRLSLCCAQMMVSARSLFPQTT